MHQLIFRLHQLIQLYLLSIAESNIQKASRFLQQIQIWQYKFSQESLVFLAGFQPKSPSQPSDDDSWLVGQPEDKTIVFTVDEQVYALDFNNTASYILDALALAGISTQSVKKLRFSSSVQNACMFVSSGFDALEEIRFSDETTLLLCLPTATTSGYFNYGLCAGMPALKKVVFPASLYSCRKIFADCPNCTEVLFNGRTQADIESMNGYPFGVDSSILKPGI